MHPFLIHRPEHISEAVRLLQTLDEPKLLAGGQTLIPTLKQRLNAPAHLIDLGRISELSQILASPDAITIGAMARHATVAQSDLVRSRLPALAQTASLIGDPQVRNRGTIGGSLANNDPASDYPAAVLALNATIQTSKRTLTADAFFRGMFETAMDEDEIIVSVRFPVALRAGYAKFRAPASRYALVGVFIAVFADSVRVAITGAAPAVFRYQALEAALRDDFSIKVLDAVSGPFPDLNSDIHANAEYRAHLIQVMARQAIETCLSIG